MRRRKVLVPLTLDALRSIMAPGKTYTASVLACIFDGSPAAITELLQTLVASGHAQSMREPRQLECRRMFWIVDRSTLAERRIAPSEIPGELRGYDLMRHQRLCMASRR